MGKNVPSHIVIHTSDSSFGDAKEIRDWHLKRGFTDIGYHYVILNGVPKSKQKYSEALDGVIEKGRKEDEEGAHAVGLNRKSIGVCLIGKHGVYTTKQLDASYKLVLDLMEKYKIASDKVIGHYEVPSGANQGKTCPDMEMDDYRSRIDFLKLKKS